MSQTQYEYPQRHVIDAHVNPLRDEAYFPESLKKTKEIVFDPSEKAELQAVQVAAHYFFSRTIRSELAQVLPDQAAAYKPPPLAELWTYRGQELEDKGQRALGDYWSGGHLFAINIDNIYPHVIWATIHETAHSVSRSLSEYQVVVDESNNVIRIVHFGALTGFDVRSSRPTIGQVLNEGMMEYLTAEFLLNSTQPSAIATKEHIVKFMADSLDRDPSPQLVPGYIAAFAAGAYTEGSEYGEAYQLINLLLKQHPELRPLFISSLVSPRAKFRLIQKLRHLYGHHLTRELFHAQMNEGNPYHAYDLQVLQEHLMRAGYQPKIERYGRRKPEPSLKTKIKNLFSGKG